MKTLLHSNKEKSLVYFLDICAKRYPNKTAIKFHDRTLTYKEVDEISNKLAHLLLNKNIGVGNIVALALDRSPEMIICLLSILKSGAAYLPLDPEYPKDRVEFMLEDSAANVLITSKKYDAHFASAATKILIENAWKEMNGYEATAPDITMGADDLAYILYTSGSTGKPKGVQISYGNLINLLLSIQKEPGINEHDHVLAITTVSFDIAALELYLPLISGAQLILTDSVTAKDGRLLLDLIKSEKISIMQATPYTWRMMLEAGWEESFPLKIFCGGEAMPKELAGKLLVLGKELWNMYGPTETTIYSTIKHIENENDITIGKPIANTEVYILDENFNSITDGSIGEIFIGGDGVAKGYLNRPALTVEKFINNPFINPPGTKMYRTGDLGRCNENGDIECLGRIDHQVKIRGYRIELGEIEHALLLQPDIKEVVVIARENILGARLAAYVVLKSGEKKYDLKSQTADWHQALATVFPQYMIPDDFVIMSSIPITLNGKIDRKSLPEPDYSSINRTDEYVAPRTEIEKQVAEIWEESMGLNKISIFDNFFTLGGKSLVAVKIMARIERLTGKRLPLATLFEYSTIERLALRLNLDSKSISWDSLVPIKRKGSKMPLYIVHGGGLNVLLFNTLAMNMDEDQPVYGLQAKGLNGIDEPLDVMENIAANYIAEILAQNPAGPYALAGYSLGGTIAYEMARQLTEMGKEVKMLAVFDTNIVQTDHYLPLSKKVAKRTQLFIMKFLYTFVLLAKDPIATIEYKSLIVKRTMIRWFWKIKGTKNKRRPGFFSYDHRIDEANEKATRNYYLQPLNVTVDLFKAKKRVFYMADFDYLGWREFALKGVNVHDIPGEHNTIFAPPNDKQFAVILQQCLDRASSNR